MELVGIAFDAPGALLERINNPINYIVGNAQEVIDAAAGNWFEAQPFESTQTRKERQAEEQARETVRLVNRGATSPEAILATAAQLIREQNPELSLYQAAASAQEFLALPENFETMRDAMELSGADAEEVVRQIAESTEQESGLKSLLDTGLNGIIEVGAVYGMVLDRLAVHLVDVLGDVGQGALGSVGIKLDDYDGPTGLAAFKSTWDWTEAERLSDYWGVSGSAGMWIDLGANLLIDPLTWWVPSSAARRGHWAAAISDPARVGEFMRQPSTRRIAEQFIEAKRAGDKLGMEHILAGMPFSGREALIYGNLDEVDDALRAFANELPA